jgi:hypothetical protein
VVDHGGANLVGMSVRHHDISLSNLLKKKKTELFGVTNSLTNFLIS